MPRYFFSTDNGEYEEDREGVELPDKDAARIQAVTFAGACVRDDPDTVWDGRRFVVEVKNERREVILRITVEAEGPAAA